MVKQLKTLNVAQGGYESPTCKVYSISAESRILAGSDKFGDANKAGTVDDEDTDHTYEF